MLANQAQASGAVAVDALGLQRHAAAMALDKHNATQVLISLGTNHARDSHARDHINNRLARLKGIVEHVER